MTRIFFQWLTLLANRMSTKRCQFERHQNFKNTKLLFCVFDLNEGSASYPGDPAIRKHISDQKSVMLGAKQRVNTRPLWRVDAVGNCGNYTGYLVIVIRASINRYADRVTRTGHTRTDPLGRIDPFHRFLYVCRLFNFLLHPVSHPSCFVCGATSLRSVRRKRYIFTAGITDTAVARSGV